MALTKTTIRLDEQLLARVAECADQRGISFSDYIRQAVVARIAWDAALQAIQFGISTSDLMDMSKLAAALEQVSKNDESPAEAGQ